MSSFCLLYRLLRFSIPICSSALSFMVWIFYLVIVIFTFMVHCFAYFAFGALSIWAFLFAPGVASAFLPDPNKMIKTKSGLWVCLIGRFETKKQAPLLTRERRCHHEFGYWKSYCYRSNQVAGNEAKMVTFRYHSSFDFATRFRCLRGFINKIFWKDRKTIWSLSTAVDFSSAQFAITEFGARHW